MHMQRRRNQVWPLPIVKSNTHRTPWCCLAALCLVQNTWAVSSYTITDLGNLGGSSTQASAINNRGEVVGYGLTQYGMEAAFKWTRSDGITQLSLPGNSRANDVNDNGYIVGGMYSQIGSGNGFVRSPDGSYQVAPNGNPAAGIPYTINNGNVVGGTQRFASDFTPFVWTSDVGTQTPPGAGGVVGQVSSINDSGYKVGYSNTTNIMGYRWYTACLWDQGNHITTISGMRYATDINESNFVVGYTGDYSTARAMAWSQTAGLIDLGAFSNGSYTYSQAAAVNDTGVIVGFSEVGLGDSAALWDSSSTLWNLNTLSNAYSQGWALSRASDINNAGQIVGYGTFNQQTHAFLLTPIAAPEPASVALLGLGVLGMLAYRRKSA